MKRRLRRFSRRESPRRCFLLCKTRRAAGEDAPPAYPARKKAKAGGGRGPGIKDHAKSPRDGGLRAGGCKDQSKKSRRGACPEGVRACFSARALPGGGAFFRVASQQRQSFRSSPQKKRATVPGPVWLPMVVPMELMSTLPLRWGKAASTRSATARASS